MKVSENYHKLVELNSEFMIWLNSRFNKCEG